MKTIPWIAAYLILNLYKQFIYKAVFKTTVVIRFFLFPEKNRYQLLDDQKKKDHDHSQDMLFLVYVELLR